MKNIRRWLVGLLLFMGLLAGSGQLVTAHAAVTLPKVDAKAGLAVDANSGQILYQQNAKQVLPIGSMTKLMTVYLTLQAIQQGKLHWQTKVKVTDQAYQLTKNKELTNVPLAQNGTYTVKTLYEAALISSANSAAILLGDAFAGNQTQAVNQMRALLKKWGISDATIVNTSGLNNEDLAGHIYPGSDKKAENKMTAEDMALVARHLLQDFPQVLQTTKLPKLAFKDTTTTTTDMTTWNYMLPGQQSAVKDLPVDGLKTGTTAAAGACFTGTVKRAGSRLITVVMHANQGEKDPKARFTETAKIMHAVYQQEQPITLHPQATVKIKAGKTTTVAVRPQQKLTYWVPKGQKATYRLQLNTKLTAPVPAHTKAGVLHVKLPMATRTFLNDTTSIQVPVYTQKTVAKASLSQRIGRFWNHLF